MNCSISTQCVRCHKRINNRGSSGSGTVKPPGALAYCQNCRVPAILCSIWSAYIFSITSLYGAELYKSHLPVRKLIMFCNGCGHGGHQICYRRFYSQHPMIEVAVERSDKPTQRKRPLPISRSRDLSRGRQRDMRVVAAAPVTGEKEEQGPRKEIEQGPRREIEQDVSVPEKYLIALQEEKEQRERIKTKVQGHLCAEGCGHICWVANELFTLS